MVDIDKDLVGHGGIVGRIKDQQLVPDRGTSVHFGHLGCGREDEKKGKKERKPIKHDEN